ncbi:MAG: hypothetical protein HKN47_19590 [Pirellulaceae bacterium]|nr:hypothetical protein [Pirellulaceae bacterium]
MFRFTLRHLIAFTAYSGLAFAVSNALGVDHLVAYHFVIGHVAILSILGTASVHYRGPRRSFVTAALIAQAIVCGWLLVSELNVFMFNVISAIGFLFALFAGSMAYSTHLSLYRVDGAITPVRFWNLPTVVLDKLLPPIDVQDHDE